ncbi:MAG: MarR family transcriptional regulator [Peptostreptococcaceae bacterium]|nr:MarR family transcriptional regulator [Peptostreptococcaceae bacterium]
MAQNEFSNHSGYFIQEIARKTNYLLNGLLAPLGITYAQFRVLNCLWKKRILLQKEIHEVIEVKPSTLTGLIDLLEAKRLLGRSVSEVDARANRIRLTEKGRELMEPAWKVIEAFENRMTEGIDESGKKGLIIHLKRINGNLE